MNPTYRFRIALFCVALSGASTLSCDPEVPVSRWNPVPYEQILADMRAPTGALDPDDPVKTVRDIDTWLANAGAGGIEESINFLQRLYYQMEPIIDALEASDSGATHTDDTVSSGAQGTTVYARFACIGPDVFNRIEDFSNGELYLESPTFSLESLRDNGLAIHGDILGEFRNRCLIGDGEVSGEFPSFFSDPEDHLMMELDVAVAAKADSTLRIRFPVLILRNAVSFLLTTSEGSNYLIEFKIDDGAVFSVGTVQGFYSCTIGGPGIFSCTWPGED